jgi:hypothetical protein
MPMVEQATLESELFSTDLVPSSIWMPNENGRFERTAAFPVRRSFLQRVRPYETHALLEWVDPLGSILAPGSPVDLAIRIAKTWVEVIPCEVDASRQDRGSSAGYTTYRFSGEGFLALAALHAQVSGRPVASGFRDGHRFPIDQAARVSGGSGRARLKDLSRQGMQLTTRERVWSVGDVVELELKRGWFRTEELGLRVVWTTGDGRENRIGARIVEAQPHTQRWLAETLGRWASKRKAG